MSNLKINGVEKSFGGVAVLKGVDLDIRSGEFFTLLGPSGCGKTTLMRIVAGFLTQDRGSVVLGDQPIDRQPAHKRDIGMVFQDYAVFPHLSVADNVGFGLKTRGVDKRELTERVSDILRMVQLDGLAHRFPAELSGGQQQRVGLARAMVIRPKLLLMDEPLSNLDAKLRLELREDIRALQRRLGVTTIYVTHDQEEALAISDRICVMHKGVAEQVGTPHQVYSTPQRRFVAGFVGAMNFMAVPVNGTTADFGGTHLKLAEASTGTIDLAIRPEHVHLAQDRRGDDVACLDGTIERITYLGTHALCAVATRHGALICHIPSTAIAQVPAEGATVSLALPLAHLRAFNAAGDLVEVVR